MIRPLTFTQAVWSENQSVALLTESLNREHHPDARRVLKKSGLEKEALWFNHEHMLYSDLYQEMRTKILGQFRSAGLETLRIMDYAADEFGGRGEAHVDNVTREIEYRPYETEV